jgi:hypothetical protein
MEEGSFQNQRIIGFLKRFNAKSVCVCVFWWESPIAWPDLKHSAPGSFFGFLS